MPPLFEADIRAALSGKVESTKDESQRTRVEQTSTRPLRILLVEDHPINQRLALHHLGRWGHTMTVADDGQAALDSWSAGTFDLILMDVHMPIMDGFTATRAIRAAEPEGTRIPIIALTANTMKGDAEACAEAGMDAHVAKPVDFAHLFACIEAYGSLAPRPDKDAPEAV